MINQDRCSICGTLRRLCVEPEIIAVLKHILKLYRLYVTERIGAISDFKSNRHEV